VEVWNRFRGQLRVEAAAAAEEEEEEEETEWNHCKM